MFSRSAWTLLVSPCTALMPSPPACATWPPPAVARCIFKAPTRMPRRRLRPIIWPPTKTDWWPPSRCVWPGALPSSRPWPRLPRKRSSLACNTKAMTTWRVWRATLPPPFFIRWAPPPWAVTTTRWRCSTAACVCATVRVAWCKGCVWWTRGPCPPSPVATPTARH